MKFDPKLLEVLKPAELHPEAIADLAERRAEEQACSLVAALLKRYGSPLVCHTVDGVLVCRNGRWAHGKDLPRALEALREKTKGG